MNKSNEEKKKVLGFCQTVDSPGSLVQKDHGIFEVLYKIKIGMFVLMRIEIPRIIRMDI